MSRETPKTIRLWLHYRKLGIDKGWSRRKVEWLCKRAKVNHYELGMLFCITQVQMDKWMNNDYIPPYVALHFALFDQYLRHKNREELPKPLIPSHLLND